MALQKKTKNKTKQKEKKEPNEDMKHPEAQKFLSLKSFHQILSV